MLTLQTKPAKHVRVVHMTSVHSSADPRIFHKECKSLARAGFDVTVVGPFLGEPNPHALKIKAFARERTRIGRMTRTVWQAYRMASLENADIYHFHDPELVPFGLLLTLQGKRVIYDIHEDVPKDVLSKEYLPRQIRPVIAWLVKKAEETLCGNFSALVTVTPAIADRLTRINPRTVVIHNFPYAEELIKLDDSVSRWEDRTLSVAYVGGISLQRAIHEMVSAMALLPDSMPAFLELAGPENSDDTSLRGLHHNPGWVRVRNHGMLDQPSTFRLLRRVRAGLVLYHAEPNHVESLPQKIFEYMGARLPVIASDFPLWRRLLGEVECGILVDPKKPGEIAEAIKWVLSHPREAEEMGKRGQQAVLTKYNWDSEGEKLVHLYREIENEKCAE